MPIHNYVNCRCTWVGCRICKRGQDLLRGVGRLILQMDCVYPRFRNLGVLHQRSIGSPNGCAYGEEKMLTDVALGFSTHARRKERNLQMALVGKTGKMAPMAEENLFGRSCSTDECCSTLEIYVGRCWRGSQACLISPHGQACVKGKANLLDLHKERCKRLAWWVSTHPLKHV